MQDFELKQLVVGPIQTNCYLLRSGDDCLVIDPGAEPDKILDAIGDAKCEYVVLTHRHWDHTGALPAVIEATGAKTAIHELDANGINDAAGEPRLPEHLRTAHLRAREEHRAPEVILRDGDALRLGDLKLKVLHTPGHTPGSMSLFFEEGKLLFAGDTLFAGGRYGRTDFAGGSMEAMVDTLGSKFVSVADDVRVLSGHGPSSTMGEERALNPYLK